MNELLVLIKKNKDAFLQSSYNRRVTSSVNKNLHSTMIENIENEYWEKVLSMLSDEWYSNPLDGVIVCSSIPIEDKSDMIALVRGW